MDVLGIKIGKLFSFTKRNVSTNPNSAGVNGNNNQLNNVANTNTVVNQTSRIPNTVYAPVTTTNDLCPHVKPDPLLDQSPVSSIERIGLGKYQCFICGRPWDIGEIDKPISAVRAKYVDDASLQDGNPKPVVVDFWSVRGVL